MIIKRGDTGIGIKATLSNQNGSINLTNASVLFLFGKHEIEPQITDAENGQVRVVFNKVHTVNSGFFSCEFEVQFPDGRIETFPNDEHLKIRIMDDLGGKS